jgi:hypothetical protein
VLNLEISGSSVRISIQAKFSGGWSAERRRFLSFPFPIDGVRGSRIFCTSKGGIMTRLDALEIRTAALGVDSVGSHELDNAL